MASHPILIRKIQHLTDARYFAAMGVDWMSMELTKDQKTFDRWHALKDWVAGVKLLAEFDFRNEELLAKVIIDANPDGVLVDHNTNVLLPEHIQVFREIDLMDKEKDQSDDLFVLTFDHPGALDQIIHVGTRLFLQSDWYPEKLNELITSGYRGGFCFEGTKEEMIGIKDYSEMDEMLELVKSEK